MTAASEHRAVHAHRGDTQAAAVDTVCLLQHPGCLAEGRKVLRPKPKLSWKDEISMQGKNRGGDNLRGGYTGSKSAPPGVIDILDTRDEPSEEDHDKIMRSFAQGLKGVDMIVLFEPQKFVDAFPWEDYDENEPAVVRLWQSASGPLRGVASSLTRCFAGIVKLGLVPGGAGDF
eukprot:TRINITY_DN107225_c0_g1_i1.p1 TRINITY_DN107225_c0_g1~~TRINITY_DN107225_c0_g1_i1.p1  ORF type:complete len:174 (-),score=32.52 TRINITY_DN107225_c0_g1_i1:185-706(-)